MHHPHTLNVVEKSHDMATTLMAQNRIPPNPINFAVWYGYTSGEHPNLSKELQDLIDRKRRSRKTPRAKAEDKDKGGEGENVVDLMDALKKSLKEFGSEAA